MAEDRKLDLADGFTKDSATQQGIDLVAYDPDTDEYVLIEAKFTSRGGNVGKGDLSTATGDRQMSDDWIDGAIDRIEGDTIDSDLADKLDTARATGNVRKEMVVVKNAAKTGKTVTDSITDVGIDRTTVIKIGEAV